jgi:hypothetical protein
MTKYSLESKLATISFKFQELEAELNQLNQVWDYLCINYNGHPLKNIDELLSNEKDMKKLFEDMGITE